MVFRTYQCKTCNGFFEKTFNSMFDDILKDIPCEAEDNCKGIANYFIGELKEQSTIIPDHMQATGTSSMKYNKIPREKRKFK